MPWISTRSIFSQARNLGFVLLEKPSTEFDMRLTSTIFTCLKSSLEGFGKEDPDASRKPCP